MNRQAAIDAISAGYGAQLELLTQLTNYASNLGIRTFNGSERTLRDLIDRLASWKVNQVQLYSEHTFAYENHPDVHAHASPFTGSAGASGPLAGSASTAGPLAT